jgi:zinc transport system ATP-binding protein
MGLLDIGEKRVGQLSGGQKQRAFVAKALVRNPEIIFLDEPIAGIDAATQERFYQKMSDLNTARGITILMVSHDLAAVFCRMSKVICVNRSVNVSEIRPDTDPNSILRRLMGSTSTSSTTGMSARGIQE